METGRLNPLPPDSMNYWQNYDKFMVWLLKAMFGKAATKENDWGYEWLPKLDGNYDILQAFELMDHRGRSMAYTRQGFKSGSPRRTRPRSRLGAGEAQIPRHHRSAEYGNGASSGGTSGRTIT